jgi:Ca2+-binding EF-hand superfamily protein
MIFQFWDKEVDEHLTYQAIVAMILKHCGSNSSYEKVKEAFLKGVDYV